MRTSPLALASGFVGSSVRASDAVGTGEGTRLPVRAAAAALAAGLAGVSGRRGGRRSAAEGVIVRSAEPQMETEEVRKDGWGVAVAAVVIALGVVGAVYGLSTLLGLPLLYGGLALGIQWATFLLHGWPKRSEAFYDASGSLTHLAVAGAALLADPTRAPRQLLLGVFSIIWCTRLGTFLFNRIAGDGKDDRFTALKTSFWRFSIPWNLQVAWVFLLQLPILVVNSAATQPEVGWLDGLGWALWAAGFLIESAADAQKFAFRSVASNKGRYITTGLWKYSRHPNYFGEIMMWVGICVSASSVFSNWTWLGWLSPAFNTILLGFVSGVPMLEKAGEKKWGNEEGYKNYMKNTSCIVPWIPAPPLSDGGEAK